jgi:hypothetical protein
MSEAQFIADLSFLHLSDIHFRKGRMGDVHDEDSDLRNELERDLRTVRTTLVQKLDGIIISGDIAFGGQPEEFAYAHGWIERIRELLDCPLPGIMTIPGNHDVNRRLVEPGGDADSLHERIWTRSDHMSVLSKFISRIGREPALLEIATDAMVDAGAWDAVAGLIDNFGSVAAAHALTRLEASQSNLIELPNEVFEVLRSKLSIWADLLDTSLVGSRCLRILSAELDPRSQYVKQVSHKRWLMAAELTIKFADERRSLHSAVFFLSVGLGSYGSAELVATAFSQIYNAAKNNTLNNSLWEQLEPNLSWYSPNWDKCARLIRTVARAFKERSWPLHFLCATFKTDEELRRALAEIGQMWGGSRFLRRIKVASIDGEIPGTPEQLAVLAAIAT